MDNSAIGEDIILFEDVNRVPLLSEPKRLNCLLFAMCLRGRAQYTVDTTEHLIKANDMIILSSGQVVENYMLSPDCKGIAVMISADFFEEIVSNVHELSSLFLFAINHPVFTLREEEVQTISNYFRLIKMKVDDTRHHFRKETVRMLISALIYDMSNVIYKLQHLTTRKQGRAEAIFTDFIRLVEQNFRTERRVSWYGQQLCITPKYLSETVKQVSRRTPNEWIDNYVILEIRVLLKNSAMSIKEIAQYLHFPNQSFLGKYFKEHVGLSPSEYRSQ